MRRIVVSLVLWSVFVVAAYGEDLYPPPLFLLEKVEPQELVIEHVYSYLVQYYRQPLKMKVIRRIEARFDTPEEAFIALTSAMKSNDIAWAKECWDVESRKKLEKYLEDPVMVQTVKQGWKELFAEADFFLLRRVDRSGGVILDYTAKKAKGDEFRNTMNFRLENGKWKATNFFNTDPVANNLSQEKDRIRVQED